MVPAAYVGSTIDAFAPLLSPGDTLIDGGNSWYRDDVDRAGPLAAKGINYLDVGTSGGVFGLERGYCLMVGGPTDAVGRDDPDLRHAWRPASATSSARRAAPASRRRPRRVGCTAARAAPGTS